MLGSLPRLHRRAVVVACALLGVVLGAWVSALAVARAGGACEEMLAGLCVAEQLNLLPIGAGGLLGLLVGFLLVYDARRSR